MTERPELPPLDFAKAREWIVLQGTQLIQAWEASFKAAGIERDEARDLYAHWFMQLGDVFKRTKISREAFVTEMTEMRADLTKRVADHRYFLGRKFGKDVPWKAVVQDLTRASRGEVELDAEQQVAFLRVSFPRVDAEGESKMRYVFDCTEKTEDEADVPHIVDPTTVFLHNRVRHLLGNTYTI